MMKRKLTLCKNMSREEYLKLRDSAYKLADEVGTIAEYNSAMGPCYHNICVALDEIDELGYSLGYVDPLTNTAI